MEFQKYLDKVTSSVLSIWIVFVSINFFHHFQQEQKLKLKVLDCISMQRYRVWGMGISVCKLRICEVV